MKRQDSGYSVRQFHKDQLEMLGSRAVKDYKVSQGFLEDFFGDLNELIINEYYCWKIGSRLGYIYIGKDRRGRIEWRWDKRSGHTSLSNKRLWDFQPVMGWKKRNGEVRIGFRGLRKKIWDMSVDPYSPPYDPPQRLKKYK